LETSAAFFQIRVNLRNLRFLASATRQLRLGELLATDFLTELTELTELLERGLAVRWGDVEGRDVRGYW